MRRILPAVLLAACASLKPPNATEPLDAREGAVIPSDRQLGSRTLPGWPVSKDDRELETYLIDGGLDGTIRPISHRAFFFLVTHGGAAPFSLTSLGTLLDAAPSNDPAAIEQQADLVSTVIIEGLRLAPAP